MNNLVTVYLSLGSNLADRADNLKKAIQLLGDSNGIKIIKQSSIYETEPWPLAKIFNDQFPMTNYLNQVIEIETLLKPHELLRLTQRIEKQLGRTSKGDLAPRTIDIDILLYGNERVHSEELMIPHPRMNERKFVLLPLIEIASDVTFKEILQNCQDDTKIEVYESRKY